ncbi:M14 family metallopeptidase [Solirubrobacter phytolaccae]|uniref:M14 family metallopeptidase n=1 Tax=Solirubrobacter phytolaccae TaxID=1404360 RepID=A0A9X3NC28_9ACTN|nr:M14 family metallopeptidase [Solirubrobacter phytolaccae]MDA0183241.1 M14 family metallopeptidase [Solirubrobacter phytolaccae]
MKITAIAAALLALGASAPAYASDDLPGADAALVQVFVPNEAAIAALTEQFDVAEYKNVEADGTIMIAVDATPAERAELRAMGLRIGATIEDAGTRASVAEARDVQREADERASAWAESGVPKSRAAVAPRGETVIQRADRFTNYAGTFLYVEAFNKATVSTGPTSFSGPSQALSYAGADGVWSVATDVPRYTDGTTTPDTYMFHRQLVRLTGPAAQIPVDELTVRVASSSGAVDTSKVKSWPGGTLPPHVAGYQQGFFNRYQDPTENRAQLDRLAAEFPNLITAVNLPHLSNGYQRKAMGIVGLKTPYADQVSGTGSLGNVGTDTTQTAAIRATQALVINTKAWGHEGGNSVSVELKAPTAPDAPLSVAVTGSDIVVNLAGDVAGAPASKTADVVAALNASAPASALVTASTFRANAGQGVAQPTAKTLMKDYLNAPAHVQRGPFQQRVYRIGAHRDGTKVGVFFTCQTHAREWTTGLTCVETAERLARNYATDPETKKLLDNVEVFIHANGNPDGGHLSMYDFASQRRNMTNYCQFTDPVGRNQWGVDLNRNYTEYTRFDGPWVGASADCTVDSFSGPGEASEPETKNDMWIADTYPNIKFASNMHSFGGYFMWSPGAYMDDGKRTLSPAPNIGVEKYFFQAGEKILGRIKEHRGTVILPQRTGPIADVIYSGAGSSADDHWYRKGIIGYGFETGADKFISTETGTVQIQTGFQPPFAEATGSADPRLAYEGRDQAMEFASGNYGMIEAAYDYAQDTTAPKTSIEYSAAQSDSAPITFKFNWDDEAAVIRYTTDGSTPTLASPTYNAERPRGLGELLTVTKPGVTEVKWFATDIKGNQSAVQTQRLQVGEQGTVGGSVPATLALTLGTPAAFGAFTPGVDKEYTATTEATVLSTAGDATLTVADPDAVNPGRLVNGTFALPQPLQGLGVVKTWTAPTSNEKVPVTFKQTIGRTDALRTGSYSKVLTFTLSTTSP